MERPGTGNAGWGCAVATGRIITIRHEVVGGYQDDSHHLQWRLPSVSAREISQACNSAGVAYISERFSALGRRMVLGFRFDPIASVYEVEVRATTTTMDAMRRRLQRSRGEPSTDPFTTPRKSSTIPRAMSYPFPFYTVTIAWKGAIEDATQVQGDEEDASTTSTTSASSSASGLANLAIQCSCDDRRPGLCKHGALAARVLLTVRDGPALARGSAQQTMGEASPCSECKTPETQDRQVSSTTGKPDPFMNQGDITTVDDGTRAQYGRVALEAWSSDLPGMLLCQVKVGDDATCSLLVNMSGDGPSVNLVMSICSACSGLTESHRGPRDQCAHVRAAIALLNEKHGRDQQGQAVADMPRPVSSIVGDAHGERRHTLRSTARPTDNIARRLVFTGPSEESKEAIPDNVLDPKRSVPLVVIDDAEPPGPKDSPTSTSSIVLDGHRSEAAGTSPPREDSSSSCRKRRHRSITEISAEVSKMALKAAAKARTNRRRVGDARDDNAEVDADDLVSSQSPGGGSARATPESFRALLRHYL
ncbi:hypothetical protein FOZ62_025749 [Perkinsus olseni]|uniref:SWIM-type domain-containing protein n=1 Tax=Perkinsus olseni TaxID=32597 RepID=A0A7J6QNR8_PEROL|nr:hypothetical protein FOZ62_025749 [Perkinsus olseni]